MRRLGPDPSLTNDYVTSAPPHRTVLMIFAELRKYQYRIQK
jgi:hypothetical protein